MSTVYANPVRSALTPVAESRTARRLMVVGQLDHVEAGPLFTYCVETDFFDGSDSAAPTEDVRAAVDRSLGGLSI